VQATLQPILNEWAGTQLRTVHPSGSFSKGTANRSGTDIDLFISLKSDTTNPLKEIYTGLSNRMIEKGYAPKQRNVSIDGSNGAAVSTPVSFPAGALPPNYAVHVTPSQAAMASVSAKISSGFSVTLTPLSTVTLAAGVFDVLVFA